MAAPGHIVEAFRNLPTNRSRAAALTSLLDELSHDEWRLLKAKAAERPFTFDLIGSLPVELVAEIFTYLGIATPFRLQCVSRRWHTVLRSSDVLKPVLNKWYSKNDKPLEGEAACQGDSYALCSLKARHQHRFATGKSCGYLDMVVPDVDARNCWFREDTIVWLGATRRQLHVYNLRTGQHWEGHNEARHEMRKVTLSDQLVVFVTSDNTCHARDLDSGHIRTFRLPPAMFERLDCQGKVVAGGGISEYSIDVFVWDFDTQVCRTLSFQRVLPRPDFQILPDRAFGSVTIFSDTALSPIGTEAESRPVVEMETSGEEENAKAILYSSKFSLTGQRLSTESLILQNGVKYNNISDIIPVDREGGFAVEFATDGHLEDQDTWEHFRIGFDQIKNKFLQIYPQDRALDASVNRHVWAKNNTDDMFCVGNEASCWKDIYYRCYGDSLPVVYCMGSSEAGLATLTELPVDSDSDEDYSSPDDGCSMFLNEIFLVIVTSSLIAIWVFDEDLELPDPELCPSLPLAGCSWVHEREIISVKETNRSRSRTYG